MDEYRPNRAAHHAIPALHMVYDKRRSSSVSLNDHPVASQSATQPRSNLQFSWLLASPDPLNLGAVEQQLLDMD